MANEATIRREAGDVLEKAADLKMMISNRKEFLSLLTRQKLREELEKIFNKVTE
jgi:hypothetical protein